MASVMADNDKVLQQVLPPMLWMRPGKTRGTALLLEINPRLQLLYRTHQPTIVTAFQIVERVLLTLLCRNDAAKQVKV